MGEEGGENQKWTAPVPHAKDGVQRPRNSSSGGRRVKVEVRTARTTLSTQLKVSGGGGGGGGEKKTRLDRFRLSWGDEISKKKEKKGREKDTGAKKRDSGGKRPCRKKKVQKKQDCLRKEGCVRKTAANKLMERGGGIK